MGGAEKKKEECLGALKKKGKLPNTRRSTPVKNSLAEKNNNRRFDEENSLKKRKMWETPKPKGLLAGQKTGSVNGSRPTSFQRGETS